jgi:hypothetical protein
MIPTAKKFWSNACKNETLKSPADIMIEFAKLHCESQSERCYQASRIRIQPKDNPIYLQEEILVRDITDDNKTVWISIDKDSILNAYNLNNIK